MNHQEKNTRGLFFHELKNRYQISLIYYPGCWNDRILDNYFKRNEIVYLDDDKASARYNVSVIGSYGYYQRFGVFGHSPFKDEVFDAVFHHDNDADKEEFSDILRVLKSGGIIIHSDSGCEYDLTVKDILSFPGIEAADFPKIHGSYTLLQKIRK